MANKISTKEFLDAAEAVIMEKGFAKLTLDSVAVKAGISKGGLLHHYPTKNKLLEALVERSADNWRICFNEAYEKSAEGPGRMVRGLLDHCLIDPESWTEELRSTSSAVFAALAQDPSLIDPMRKAYSELYELIANDGLPKGVAEAIVSSIDGLWLNWVLGIVAVDEERISRIGSALEAMLESVSKGQ